MKNHKSIHGSETDSESKNPSEQRLSVKGDAPHDALFRKGFIRKEDASSFSIPNLSLRLRTRSKIALSQDVV